MVWVRLEEPWLSMVHDHDGHKNQHNIDPQRKQGKRRALVCRNSKAEYKELGVT